MTAPLNSPVHIQVVRDTGDYRGSSYSIPAAWREFLPSAVDLHLTSLKPGHVRGNHFHRTLREVILVIHRDVWTLHWEESPSGQRSRREFPGSGLVLIMIEPGAAHAVENTGGADLWTFGMTDRAYDPVDTVPRSLVF